MKQKKENIIGYTKALFAIIAQGGKNPSQDQSIKDIIRIWGRDEKQAVEDVKKIQCLYDASMLYLEKTINNNNF